MRRKNNNDHLLLLLDWYFLSIRLKIATQTSKGGDLRFFYSCKQVLNQSNIDGTSLVIHDLTGKDDGEYTCELETKVLVTSYITQAHS